ncbi:hypothetical protein BFW01_g890 [Lasiodiplodia theobromae]|uniref:Uncharacterized protein n=1 Tax=Lasiodiplodia theobromae TaxID=45133 RepID=A0A8H7IRB4_9PEZI|nr:hypothetical protein BFW01_g890 [Lasiodiplodia theobromae]
MSVPIFDVRFRGNGSLYDLYENALFQQYVDGRYTRHRKRDRKDYTSERQIIDVKQPFKGSWPGLEESAQDLFDTDGSVQPPPKQENTKRDSSRPGSFWAAPLNKDGKFYFAVNYDTGNNSLTAHLNTICTYFASTYHMNLNFVNGTEIVDIEVKKKYPLNATALDWAYLFAPYDVVDNKSSEGMATILPDDLVLFTGMGGGPKLPISDAFRDSNIRAIADGVSYALGGILLRAGSEAAIHMNTLIPETPWVKSYKRLDWTSYDFSQLTPALYEKMLRNVTMSMLSRPNTNTTVEVTMSPWENAYSFASRQSLIWPYGVSLVMSAGFIALGIVALGQNGVPADSGGFMQLLCTTTGDNLAINKEAAKCSMGGSPNFSNELKELRVRFGYIKATAEDEGKPRAGFGTEEETDAI